MALTLWIFGPVSQTKHTITELDITTSEGDLTIYENHAPMITTLAENSHITYTLEDGTSERKQFAGGIMHVERATVTIIMDT